MNRLSYVLQSIWREESNRSQRLRRVGAFLAWQAWKRTIGVPIVVRLFNGMKLRVWPDCDSSPAALYYSFPCSHELGLVRRCLKGGTFVDVGANIGLMTLLVSDKIGHALLFEPNAAACARARENLQLNGLSYEVISVALSDKTGTVKFENSGVRSTNRTVDNIETALPTITVSRTTLDSFLQENQTVLLPIDVIKIDVEGHENSVLRGMRELLRQARPRLVMFEYLARTNIVETISILRDVDYAVFELTSSGTRQIRDHQVRPLQDLFACPNESMSEFGLDAVEPSRHMVR
jgi:FkbM family methyltransferase